MVVTLEQSLPENATVPEKFAAAGLLVQEFAWGNDIAAVRKMTKIGRVVRNLGGLFEKSRLKAWGAGIFFLPACLVLFLHTILLTIRNISQNFWNLLHNIPTSGT